MTAEEIRTWIEWARRQGVRRIKTGEIEIELADGDANADMMQVFEKGLEQGRSEILRHLSDEHRAQIEQKIEESLNYGSS